MANILTLDAFNVEGKTVLVRVDFNSPVDPETQKILDDVRIRTHGTTTIAELAQKGAKVVILAHQGRPGEADFISLEQHSRLLAKILNKPVKYVDDLYGNAAKQAITSLTNGQVLVLKNVRTHPEEQKKGTPEEHAKTEFVKALSAIADLFVSDAFAAAHRSHISIVGFTAVLPSVAGRIMERELGALGRALEKPEKPCVYILGGAKADDALRISTHVLGEQIADCVLTGGVAGHIFLVAKGIDLGPPNTEFLKKKALMSYAPGIRDLISQYTDRVKTPSDLAIDKEDRRAEIMVEELPTNWPICDIGTQTIEEYVDIIKHAKSLVVSGPVGIYENEKFAKGTAAILGAIAQAEAFSLVGGGHTVAAVERLGLAKQMSYISTAGGALIEFLMGEKLPGVAALEAAAKRET